MKKYVIAAVLLAGAGFPVVAAAQAADTATASAAPAAPTSVNLTTGTKVYDPQGGEVGTIEAVSGDNIVLNTGTNRATLARSSFTTGANGPVIGMTKAQLDAAVQQASAQASAQMNSALVPGAEVRSKDGVLVGKIGRVEGDQVVLEREGGAVTLTRANLTADQQGLALVMTAAEFEAAAKAATASAAAPGGGENTAS